MSHLSLSVTQGMATEYGGTAERTSEVQTDLGKGHTPWVEGYTI